MESSNTLPLSSYPYSFTSSHEVTKDIENKVIIDGRLVTNEQRTDTTPLEQAKASYLEDSRPAGIILDNTTTLNLLENSVENMSQKIQVKVTPNAKSDEIIGWQEDILKVKIQAPAQKGLANRSLIKFLAEQWNIPKNNIKIVQGEKSRDKILEVNGTIPTPKQMELGI